MPQLQDNPQSLSDIGKGIWASQWVQRLKGQVNGLYDRVNSQSSGSTSLPDQSGHAGEYLTTNGSSASWNTVTAPSLEEVVAVGATSITPIITPGLNLVYVKMTINGLATGTTLITTLESTMGRFFISQARYVPKTVSGSIAGPGSLNIGYTAANYNDIVNIASITSSNVNTASALTLTGNGLSIPAGSAIYANFTTAVTGFTTYNIDIHLLGYYEGA